MTSIRQVASFIKRCNPGDQGDLVTLPSIHERILGTGSSASMQQETQVMTRTDLIKIAFFYTVIIVIMAVIIMILLKWMAVPGRKIHELLKSTVGQKISTWQRSTEQKNREKAIEEAGKLIRAYYGEGDRLHQPAASAGYTFLLGHYRLLDSEREILKNGVNDLKNELKQLEPEVNSLKPLRELVIGDGLFRIIETNFPPATKKNENVPEEILDSVIEMRDAVIKGKSTWFDVLQDQESAELAYEACEPYLQGKGSLPAGLNLKRASAVLADKITRFLEAEKQLKADYTVLISRIAGINTSIAKKQERIDVLGNILAGYDKDTRKSLADLRNECEDLMDGILKHDSILSKKIKEERIIKIKLPEIVELLAREIGYITEKLR